MTGTTRGRYSTTSATRISSTPFATPSFRPPASGTSGRTDCTVAPGWPYAGHRHHLANSTAQLAQMLADSPGANCECHGERADDRGTSERGAPMSAVGFRQMITRLGKAAKMPFSVHPRLVERRGGIKRANDGHDTRALQHYLGHKNIQHTVRYTELSTARFRDFWKD